MPYIKFFGDVSEEDADVGIKGINLSVLSRNGFRVPPGFIITKEVFDSLFSKMKKGIEHLFMCPDNDLQDLAYEFQDKIKSMELSSEIMDEIEDAYLSLSVSAEGSADSLLKTEEVFVAVRSSYIDDLGDVPFIHQKTLLNIKGRENLKNAILDCYSELFSRGNMKYRRENKLKEISTALIIQRMINSDASGVAFSYDPDSSGERNILIRAAFGLGSGDNDNQHDDYLVDPREMMLKNIKIADKKFQYTRDIETDLTTKIDLGAKSGKQAIDDRHIIEIAGLVKKAVRLFGCEQKVEWVKKNDYIFIMQSKAIPEKLIPEEPVETYDPNEAEEMPPEMIDIETYDEPKVTEQELPEENLVADEAIDSSEEYKSININITPEEENLIPETKTAEEILIKENSIFSSYKGFDEKSEAAKPGSGRLAELARLSSGSCILYCSLAIKEKLGDELKKFTEDCPEGLIAVLDLLVSFEPVGMENDIRKLDNAVKEFLTKNMSPDPEVVALGLKLI